MLDVLTITGVIFILIAIGYGSVARGMFAPAELKVLGKFVVNFALPALIFKAVSSRDLQEVFDPVYLSVYLAGSLTAFFAGYFVSRRLIGKASADATFAGMGMSCSNSGFIGYPMFLIALPSLAGTVLTLNMMIENFIMIPLVLLMAERAARHGAPDASLFRQVGLRLIRNPIVLAMLAAVLVSVAGVPLPEILTRSIDLIAAASAALSLIVIGGTLVGMKLNAINLNVIAILLGKLLLMPLVVAGAIVLLSRFGIMIADQRLAQAAIISAAIPPMAIYPILAQSYGAEKDASLAMALMTGASFVTLTALLWLLQFPS
ncbi:AEC family transporter [Roseibium sp.]|uniref:AEC family transporter n=1 Tax=Roseibium sp. TaxID=1936156 RepID=UPI003A97C100